MIFHQAACVESLKYNFSITFVSGARRTKLLAVEIKSTNKEVNCLGRKRKRSMFLGILLCCKLSGRVAIIRTYSRGVRADRFSSNLVQLLITFSVRPLQVVAY